MTPKQLRATLASIGLSQRAAARLLDINDRTVRKYVAGDLVIPELLVWALRGLAQREQDEGAA
jgi:predicted transcriptional regulator